MTEEAEPEVIHLHQRSLLRIWLVTQILFQVVAYLAVVSLIVDGLTTRDPDGGLARPGYAVAGIIGLIAVVGFAVVRNHMLLQPPLRIDLVEKTIEARSGSFARSRLPFAVAETMELRTGFLHQLYLAPSDRRRDRFRLNLTRGGRRRDGGHHPLAPLLPTPLAELSDGVFPTGPASWGDAARLACFLDLRRRWTAGSDPSQRPPRPATGP